VYCNVRCQFIKIVKRYYVNKIRTKEPGVRCEMKLKLDDSKTFSCTDAKLTKKNKNFGLY